MRKIEKPSNIYLALLKIADKLNNIVVSIFSDQKDYFSSCYLSSNSSNLLDNIYTKINFDTKVSDPENCFDTTLKKWICPVSGFYDIQAHLYFAGALDGTQLAVAIYKNGVQSRIGYTTSGSVNQALGCPVNDQIYLDKGDIIEFYARKINSSATSCYIFGNPSTTYFSIAKINSYITPTPTQTQIKARCKRTTSAQVLSSAAWNKIQFNSKIFDPLNCLDLTTNYRFTAPEAGYYYIGAGARFGVNGTGVRSLKIEKNGTTTEPLCQTLIPTCTSYYTPTICVSCVEYMNKDDYIECYAFQDSGGNLNLDAHSSVNFSIHKLSD